MVFEEDRGNRKSKTHMMTLQLGFESEERGRVQRSFALFPYLFGPLVMGLCPTICRSVVRPFYLHHGC